MSPETALVVRRSLRPSDLGFYGIVYALNHKPTGRVYVGQTVQSISRRMSSHKRHTECIRLRRAIDKHGMSAFEVSVLALAHSKDELDELERKWITALSALDREKGFNIREGGSFGKHTEASKRRMSDAVRAALARPEYRLALKNRPAPVHSEQTKTLISESLKGRRLSEEHCQAISRSRLELWRNPEFAERTRAAQLAGRTTEVARRSAAEKSKAAWKDPVKRQNMLDAQRAARDRKKSGCEPDLPPPA